MPRIYLERSVHGKIIFSGSLPPTIVPRIISGNKTTQSTTKMTVYSTVEALCTFILT